MKDDEVVSYLYGDQLGSVSAVADANGSQISKTLYHPWGTTRYSQGASPTDYAYTGQMREGDVYFYNNARWPKVPATQWRGYDPAIGRFMQADTFVPTSQGTQGFDRFAYVNNNPVNGTDPTGFSCIGPNCPQIVPIPTPPVSQEVLNINPASTATPLMIYPTPVPIPTPFYYHVAPPDFKNLLPDGNPPPPAVEGLSDEWTWEHPSGYPPGYTNPGDPGAVWRPDPGRTSKNKREGEDPHWDRYPKPNSPEKEKYPPNPEWGRGGQGRGPGAYNPKTGKYNSTDLIFHRQPWEFLYQSSKATITLYIVYRVFRIISAPVCGPLAPICAASPY